MGAQHVCPVYGAKSIAVELGNSVRQHTSNTTAVDTIEAI